MNKTLVTAGIYNIFFAYLMLFKSTWLLSFLHFPHAFDFPIWQCLALMIGINGLGYIIASFNPDMHWPFILLGLLSKIFVPIGFLYYAETGLLSWNLGWVIFMNDVIWLVPFIIILKNAFDANVTEMERIYPRVGIETKLKEMYTNRGESVHHFTEDQKTMFIFLRHFGCTFCRKTLDELRMHRKSIEANGCKIILIHNEEPVRAKKYFEKYQLGNIDFISDPRGELYREFDIYHGSFLQLFGYKTILPELYHSLKYGIAYPESDSYRMPGIFIYENKKITKSQRNSYVGEKVDWKRFVPENAF